MRKRKALNFVLLACCVGITGTVVGMLLLIEGTVFRPHATVVQTVQVVVAVRDLPIGIVTNSEKLFKVAALPAGSVPLDCIFNIRELRGQVLGNSVKGGEPIRQAHLLALARLLAEVPRELYAVDVRIRNLKHELPLLPGTRADLVYMKGHPDGVGIPETIAERSFVLGTSVAVEAAEQETRIVTLAVRPREIEMVRALSEDEGYFLLISR